MVNSRFVVINTVHNNGHGESVRFVSSFSVLIVLLVVAAIFTVVHTDARSHFQSCFSHGEYHVESVIY